MNDTTHNLSLVQKATQFAYNALIPSRLRKFVNSAIITIDDEMRGRQNIAWASVKELAQNFALINWAISTHLDFIASFNFQAKTPDRDFNSQLEKWMKRKLRKESIDAAGRMDFNSMIRQLAALRIWDGDAAFLKLPNGQLQLIEAWQIAKAKGSPDGTSQMGLVIDPATGRTLQYSICTMVEGKVEFSQMVDAENLIFSAYFPRATASRGVSPLLPVLDLANTLQDATRYYLEQARIASMFGILIKRNHSGTSNDFNRNGKDEIGNTRIKIGPQTLLDLEQQDDAKFLQNANPPTEYQAFAKEIGRQILGILGIPYSAYDSNSTTYAAMRADYTRYKTKTQFERSQIMRAAEEATEHILREAIINDEILLPCVSNPFGKLQMPVGMTLSDIEFEWIPAASFIIDKAAEVNAMVSLINAGLESRQDTSKELGLGDVFDTFDELKTEQDAIQERKLIIEMGKPGAVTSSQDQQQPPQEQKQ